MDLQYPFLFRAQQSRFLFIATLALLYVSICVETDMYVPSFPQMVLDLGTTENKIQGVLGINFLGLCLSSLWTGPLADSFGRRKTILVGMTLFVLASLGCVFSPDLPTLLFFRFIQGLGAGAPMTAGFAVLLDRLDRKSSASVIGMMNTGITLTMAGAPVLGSWVTFHFHWKMNFIIISVLGIISWLSFYLFIPETLAEEDRTQFRMKQVLKDFTTALTHPKFIAYVLICTFIFSGIIVFASNQSLIFLNYLKVSPSIYGFYQASSMGSFGIASLASGWFIRRFDVSGAMNACMAFISSGALCLILTALLFPQSAPLICLSTVLISIGGGLGIGSLASIAMDIFPNMKATASGSMGFIRLMITALIVSFSAKVFDGSILPIAIIIATSQALACLIYLWVRNGAQSRLQNSTPEDSIPLAFH